MTRSHSTDFPSRPDWPVIRLRLARLGRRRKYPTTPRRRAPCLAEAALSRLVSAGEGRSHTNPRPAVRGGARAFMSTWAASNRIFWGEPESNTAGDDRQQCRLSQMRASSASAILLADCLDL